jgi:predicted GNAT superfamily acetyltransferase
MTAEGATPHVRSHAWAQAGVALAAAGIEVRPVTSPTQAHLVREVLDHVFQFAPGESEASADLVRALAYTGHYVMLVHDLTAVNEPVLATSLGFFGPPRDRFLHSHATAVVDAGRGRRLGRALKTHQRAWTLERGVDTITWTFDPLVRRNAWFNLARLGARVRSFEPDFYGAIPDVVNDGDESDRFHVRWELLDQRVRAACAGQAQEQPVAGLLAAGTPRVLIVGPGQEPVVTTDPMSGPVLVQIPADIEAIRVSDSALARRWRYALRGALGSAFDGGLEVAGVGRDGWYVLAEPDAGDVVR